MLHYRIQVASLADEVRVVTCERQREIVRETLDAVGLPAPAIEVDSDGYYRRVLAAAKALVEAVRTRTGSSKSACARRSCLEQHEIALRACREAGIRRTSNVLLARTLGMIPVGTMGHEHVQRYGADEPAFRAMRERRPGRSSYLLDTYDTIRSGIPAAFKLIREDPGRGDSIRYDSGDKEKQYRTAVELAKSQGIRPVMILEDGWDLRLTQRFEALREEVGWKPRAVLRLRRASRRRDRARDADAGPRRRRVEAVADRRHADDEVRRRREPRQGERPRPPRALAPHAGRRSDRDHRPGGRGRTRGLRGLGLSPGRSEVHPRVQPGNPGAPDQAPEGPMTW